MYLIASRGATISLVLITAWITRLFFTLGGPCKCLQCVQRYVDTFLLDILISCLTGVDETFWMAYFAVSDEWNYFFSLLKTTYFQKFLITLY